MSGRRRTLEGIGIWEHFTVQDGLPDMKVASLFEDSKGMLWIGTFYRGVARFDGDRFKAFTVSDGLAGDRVLSILEDREGALWFGTYGGLTRYDGETFQPMYPRSGERLGFHRGRCTDGKGVLWFGETYHPWCPAAVCRWDGRHLDRISLPGGVKQCGAVFCIASDQNENVWLGVWTTLYRYDGRHFHRILGPFDRVGYIWSLLPRPDGSLWIGGEGLFVYHEGRIEPLHIGHKIKALAEDSSGAVWMATHEGKVLRYDDGKLQVIRDLEVELYDICVDRMDRVWVGTLGMGLYCYDPTRFEVFGKAQGLPSERIYALAEDMKGTIWVGTEAGVVEYDGYTIRPPEGIEKLEDRYVLSLFVDSRNQLWIGTWGNGLYVHDGRKGLQSILRTEFIGLSDITEDRKGRIWFCFQNVGGFWCYKEGRTRHFPSYDDTEVLSPSSDEDLYPRWIGALLVDSKGGLWVGTSSLSRWQGLRRYNIEALLSSKNDDDFVSFTSADGLAGGVVLSLYEDREGRIWVGTTEGVSCYDGRKFRTFIREDGLPHEVVTAITQTDDGKLWFGTEGGGVCCYDGKVLQTIRVPGDQEYNVVYAVHQDRRGRIWFGTGGGLVRYKPHQERPKISVTEVLADRIYEVGKGNAVEVPTTAGRISFRFGGKSPTQRASGLVYRYRLEGYEGEWRQTRDTRVDYPPLRPGSYRFCVQAVDCDLNYSDVAEVVLKVVEDPRIVGLTEALRSSGASGEFVGKSSALRKVLSQVHRVAPTELTVLILGETGTGKGLVARAVHGLSTRRGGPFIQINCGAIPEGLVESELFGHERGAFTGAVSKKLGKVELAEGGTLFFDEIGDLALSAQAKLLRLLEERTFERVGGTETLRADVRVVAATNRDLERMVSEGRFREDLYFRLRAFPIRVPPLREREEDIPLLVKYFAERFARHLNRQVPEIESDVMECLKRYRWPGNVRELEHVVQRAVLSCRGDVIRLEDVPDVAGEVGGIGFLSLEEHERRYLEKALEATDWVVYGPKGAARLLGVHPEKLRAKMRKYGLRRPRT